MPSLNDLYRQLAKLRAEAPALIAAGEVTPEEFRQAESELMGEIRLAVALEEAHRRGLERAADLPYRAAVLATRKASLRLARIGERKPCRPARPQRRSPRSRERRARRAVRSGSRGDPSEPDLAPRRAAA